MKRKIFNMFMVGALILPSASLFVSCKDYDDDINNLQQQIDELSKTIKAIQDQIAAGSVITSVTPTGNGVTITLSNNKTFTITNGKDGAAGKDGTAWTIGTDGYWYKDGAKTDYCAKGDAGATGTPGIYYKPNAQGFFDIYNGDGTIKEANVFSWKATDANAITAVKNADNLTMYNVDGADGKTVVISLTSKLKSLLFEPAFYYNGIEAFDFSTFNYAENTVKPVDANGDYKSDAPTVSKENTTMSPDLQATYFLNPSNAKISEKSEDYRFIAYNKAYTRANDEVSKCFNIQSADISKSGKVTVHAKYNGNVIKNIADDGAVTVLALQYSAGDTTITSDFAAIKANTYKGLILNHALPEYATCSPLFGTANAAISGDASVKVAWNNDKGIDLRKYVNTHRIYNDGACVNWDKNASEGLVEKDGFKYSFELVGYTTGANETSQSAHAAIASDGYTLRPQITKDGKQQAFAYSASVKNNAQSAATIGREPLVRVLLTDVNNNKIAAVGYIKIAITDETADPIPCNVSMPTVVEPYTVSCGDGNKLLQTITWFQVEEQIIAELKMSKSDFEANYSIDGTVEDANQFDKNANLLGADDKIGAISQTKSDVDGTMTEVLKWNINNQKAYSLFKAGKTSVETYVRYKKNVGGKGSYDYVYVKFTWTPSAVNIKPYTTFGNDSKIKNYWYASNSNVAGSGYNDIHGNVEVVGTQGADDEYIFDVRNALVGNKLSTPLENPYSALNNDLVSKFYFRTGNGLYASEDGTAVYAEKTLDNVVATIDPATGIISYSKNEVAEKLLNAHSHDDLSGTVTAVVAVTANICGNIDVPVSNNTFNVKFLRPINVTDGTVDFTDAETEGSTSAVALTFTDWRNHDFTNVSVTKGHNYFDYYGVKSISVDIENAKSDLNGNATQLLKNITDKVKFSYSPAGTIGSGKTPYGQLTYVNNGLTVGSFHVYFPVKITYDWGTINTFVTATVGKTTSNSKRR